MKKLITLRWMICIFAYMIFSISVNGQEDDQYDDCAPCTAYLDKMFNIKKTSENNQSEGSFSEFFFSDKFQGSVQGKKRGGTFNVGYKGVEIGFGGSKETSNAWEIRKQNMHSKDWDFSKVNKESFFEQYADFESRNLWLSCIKLRCPANTNNKDKIFTIDVKADKTKAYYTFKYNTMLWKDSEAPVYKNFICSDGLNCEQAIQNYREKTVARTGDVLEFTWNNNDEVDGWVMINTDRGISEMVIVKKPGITSKGFKLQNKTVEAALIRVDKPVFNNKDKLTTEEIDAGSNAWLALSKDSTELILCLNLLISDDHQKVPVANQRGSLYAVHTKVIYKADPGYKIINSWPALGKPGRERMVYRTKDLGEDVIPSRLFTLKKESGSNEHPKIGSKTVYYSGNGLLVEWWKTQALGSNDKFKVVKVDNVDKRVRVNFSGAYTEIKTKPITVTEYKL